MANTDSALPPIAGSRAGGSLSFVIALSAVAAVGGFLFGFDSSVINGTVGALKREFGTDAAGTGFAVASALLGCAAGAFVAGATADRIGRRPTMLITAIAFLISAIATGAASTAGFFIFARIVGGAAIGAASILAPMYISEIAPQNLRGRLASLQQLAIVLGIFFAFLSNLLIAHLAGGAEAPFWLGAAAWRWMFWMEAIPSAVFLVGVVLIPESPRYLVAIGKRSEAVAIFARISGDYEALVQQVEKSLRSEHRPRFSDLIEGKTRRLETIVWVGVGLAAFQQLVGINIIFYYGEVLWRMAGASEQSALRINLLSGFVNILSTFLAIALIDRWGRRPLLIAGSIGMTITLAVMAVVFSSVTMTSISGGGAPQLSQTQALVGLVAANLYIVAFGVSWGPVVWVLLGEMFPNRLRGAAMSVSGCSNWLANFLVTVTFLPLVAYTSLSITYGLYAAAAALSLLFVWFSVRETKGKALEEF